MECRRTITAAPVGPIPGAHFNPAKDPGYWAERARALGLSSLGTLIEKPTSRKIVELAYSGDRTLLAECLIGLVPYESRPDATFATSLRPSLVRPYQLVLTEAPA
jgi:hypothetical protein